jgi:hypothetical protein
MFYTVSVARTIPLTCSLQFRTFKSIQSVSVTHHSSHLLTKIPRRSTDLFINHCIILCSIQ